MPALNNRFMLLFLVIFAAMLENLYGQDLKSLITFHTGEKAMLENLYGQDTSSVTKEHHYWANAGLGLGLFRQSDGDIVGLGGGIGLSYRIRNRIISLRYVHIEEITIFGPSPSESVSDLGALYGIITKGKYGFASLSGGISFVRGVRRGKLLSSGGGWGWSWFGSSETYEELTFHTFGIPIEAQLFWTPLSFLGIGIYAAGNLNSQRSFAAVLLCLQLGKLR